MDIGIATGIGVGLAAIGVNAVLDRAIDVTSHDHRTVAYRIAMKPSRYASYAIAGGALALAGIGLLAGTSDQTRHLREPLLKVAGGIGAGMGAAVAVRLGWGLTIAPAQSGWRPGMQAVPHLRLGDLAANSVDRVHMMGRRPDLTRGIWQPFDWISRAQGHGPLAERTDLVPVLRYRSATYRSPTPSGVDVLDA